MIDTDPQPSLSSYYAITNQNAKGLVEVFNNPQTVNECVSKTHMGDLIIATPVSIAVLHEQMPDKTLLNIFGADT